MRRLKTSLMAVGITATAIVATIAAFLGATDYSTVDAHLGSRGIEVESDQKVVAHEGFYSELAEFARQNDFDVSISYSSLEASNGEYRVYSSSVSPNSGRLERPRFERGQVDIFYPLEGFPQPDPRQILDIKGSDQDQQELLRWLAGKNLEATVMTNEMVDVFMTSTIPVLLVLSVLLCLVLGAGHVLARSREIGVHRLLGLSFFETLRIEARRQYRTLLSVYIGGPLIVALLLFAYNGWAMASVFWSIYFVVSLVLAASLLFGYLGGQYLVRSTSIPQSIKGRMHARPILYSLVAVRCVALIAALSSVATTVGFVAEVDARQHLQQAWDAHSGPQEFALNTNTAFEDWTGSESTEPFRAADRAGDVLLVDPYWITWPTQLEAPVLLVNQEFARRAGAPAVDGQGVTVCSPEELSRDSKGIIEEGLSFEASFTDDAAPRVEWRADCRLGPVFTYDVAYRPEVNNPILVILPLGLAPLGGHNLMSKVSQQVLISASADVPSKLLKGATGNTLSFVRPHEDSWQKSIRKAERNAVEWGLNTVAAALLVTVLVGATVITFRVAYRRKIHVAYIAGRSPWWVSKQVVLTELAFFFATIGWLIYKVHEHFVQADSHIPSTWNIGFDNQWSALPIAAVLTFGAAWLVAATALTVRAASKWDAREGMEPQ